MIIPLDYIAGTLTLVGIWIVGNKNKYGFIIAMFSNIAWIIYALAHQHTFGVIFECLPLLFINARNFLKWSKHDS